MEAISFIVLILLSLVGYSAGASAKAGKTAELKPQIIDLILVALIWAGGIYTRITFDLNKWLLIFLWLILSIIVGALAVWSRKLSKIESSSKVEFSNPDELKGTSRNLLKAIWQHWKEFSRRMGSFQSRIMLSFFFFLFVSPFALAVKMFSDPLILNLKNYSENQEDLRCFFLLQTQDSLLILAINRQISVNSAAKMSTMQILPRAYKE